MKTSVPLQPHPTPHSIGTPLKTAFDPHAEKPQRLLARLWKSFSGEQETTTWATSPFLHRDTKETLRKSKHVPVVQVMKSRREHAHGDLRKSVMSGTRCEAKRMQLETFGGTS